jgi:phosphoglycolate phosphatase
MVTVACNWGYCGAVEPSTWGADYLLDTPTDLLQTLRAVVESTRAATYVA